MDTDGQSQPQDAWPAPTAPLLQSPANLRKVSMTGQQQQQQQQGACRAPQASPGVTGSQQQSRVRHSHSMKVYINRPEVGGGGRGATVGSSHGLKKKKKQPKRLAVPRRLAAALAFRSSGGNKTGQRARCRSIDKLKSGVTLGEVVVVGSRGWGGGGLLHEVPWPLLHACHQQAAVTVTRLSDADRARQTPPPLSLPFIPQLPHIPLPLFGVGWGGGIWHSLLRLLFLPLQLNQNYCCCSS